jgi:hypothetical protein
MLLPLCVRVSVGGLGGVGGLACRVPVSLVLTGLRTASQTRTHRALRVLLGTARGYRLDVSTPRKISAIFDVCEDEALAPIATAMTCLYASDVRISYCGSHV